LVQYREGALWLELIFGALYSVGLFYTLARWGLWAQ